MNTRRTPARGIWCLFLLLLFCTAAQAAKPNKHTNVVLILIDDISHYGVTAYGANVITSNLGRFDASKIATPNIDDLAHEGFMAEHAYAYPLCENTRVALMSGKYNKRNFISPKALHDSDITFGDIFQRAGYATGLFGKWKQSRGTKEISAERYLYAFGWDEYTAFDLKTGSQRFINPLLVVNGKTADYRERQDLDPATGRRWYGPDIVNRHALSFIEKNKNKPFFLYYPMLLIHDEHQPTPDTVPKSVFDNFIEKKTKTEKTTKRKKKKKREYTGDDHKFLPDMIAYADTLIGKVINKLEEQGLRENTLVIIVGDNGTKESFTHVMPDGTRYPGRKAGNADNGIHVPLIASMPKTIPRKTRYNGLIHITDIFPTIADAAGIALPNKADIDGISFWRQIHGDTSEPRQHIHHWSIGNSFYQQPRDPVEYVFNKDFKRYAPSAYFPNGRFFDLRSDRLERVGQDVHEFEFKVKRYSGLAVNKLDKEQKSAYNKLGHTLNKYQYVGVKKILLDAKKKAFKVGETAVIKATLVPKNATRNGLIWVSSHPDIASINKFGEITAKAAGKTTITTYSWDDAEPLASGKKSSFKKDGIQSSLTITVQ